MAREILLTRSRFCGREKVLTCQARETFDGPPGSLDERKKKDVIDRTELRAVLSRENLSVTELNAIGREYLKNGIPRSHFFQALLQESQDGDVLSKVGLSLWRKILSEASEILPNADSAFIIHVLQRTMLGRVRIRRVDLDSWLGLFIDYQWLDAFNVVMAETDAIAEWMSSFTQHQVIVPRIAEALQLLAPALRTQNQAIKIGHQCIEHSVVDILVLDCCIKHQIPFELANGVVHFSLGLWLQLAKKTGSLPSDLGNTLDDPEFGQPVRRAFAMWLANYQFDDQVLELAMGTGRLSQVLADAAADRVKSVVDTDLRNATNHTLPLSKPGIRKLLLHDPKLVDLLRTMDFPQLLQRAMQAGVLDEIGWRSFDEAIDAYQPAWVNHYCHIHLHFVFPYVSFIVGSEVVICGPDSYEVRPIPEWLPLTIVRWIIPVGRDVLFIFELPTPPSNLDPSDSEYGIWLSNPEVRKRFPRGQHFARGAILVEISKNRYSLGGRPFRVGQLPIDLPRTCVFAEGDSVWTIHLKPTSVVASEGNAKDEGVPLKGYNYKTGERLNGRLPKFFESHLLPNHTPILKASSLLPLPHNVTRSSIGFRDGKYGFFVQVNPSGVIKAIGMDGRQVSRKAAENAHGVTYCDVPLCMMDKPSSNGYWTRIQRQVTTLWIDESTGDLITSSPEKSRNQPGQLIDPPLHVFWSLYTLRCEQTSEALRNMTRASVKRLLLATQHVASPNSTTDYHLEKHQFDGMRVAIAREFPHAPARLQDGIAAVCLTAAILAKAVQEVLGPDKTPPWPACWEE